MQKALKKTDLMINYEDVIVEASFMEDAPTRIPIPELIGDPDVPAALVKNPTRTAKIKQLTRDISSCQLQEALAFCKSGISSFSLGSSSSVAYIEFEVRLLSLLLLVLSSRILEIAILDSITWGVVGSGFHLKQHSFLIIIAYINLNLYRYFLNNLFDKHFFGCCG